VVYVRSWDFFLIGRFGGGVQLVPLGTAATNRRIVSTAGDYDDAEFGGMMMWQGKPKYSEKICRVPICPPQTPTCFARTRTRAASLGSQRLKGLGNLSRYSDGLRAGRPGFGSQQGRDFSLLHGFQIGSVAHPTSYPMSTGDSFRGGKARRA
jgi:hypothetical protein